MKARRSKKFEELIAKGLGRELLKHSATMIKDEKIVTLSDGKTYIIKKI